LHPSERYLSEAIMTKPSYSRRSMITLPALLAGQAWLPPAKAAEEPHPNKPTFISLGEFTVNLPDDGAAAGYVVIAITLEVAPQAAGDFNDILPRLKDQVIQRLMTMAAQGMLQPGHADPVMLKTVLLDSVTKMHPNSVREVLITRFLYG
jgi:flagellar basal body-associated protein FliL